MKALSTRNDEPERASRPFDRDRDGFVISEGAGIVVVEELEHAKARGAKIYCETHRLRTFCGRLPHDCAAARRRRRGARHASGARTCTAFLLIRSITSMRTPPRLISATFARRARSNKYSATTPTKLPISSTKSMTGHLLGGAGGIEMAACALAIRDSVIPPTINLENPGEECDLDYTPNVARERKCASP